MTKLWSNWYNKQFGKTTFTYTEFKYSGTHPNMSPTWIHQKYTCINEIHLFFIIVVNP